MSMGKILVADDDQNIAELLRLYLEKEGYTVVLAADGEQAIERFSAENPDIVLLDIMMPKLDGGRFAVISARNQTVRLS